MTGGHRVNHVVQFPRFHEHLDRFVPILDLTPYRYKWTEFKDYQIQWVRERGLSPENVVPVVRCFHHLKEGARRSDGPTFNILLTRSTTIHEYPYNWQLDYKALTPGAAEPTPKATRRAEN